MNSLAYVFSLLAFILSTLVLVIDALNRRVNGHYVLLTIAVMSISLAGCVAWGGWFN